MHPRFRLVLSLALLLFLVVPQPAHADEHLLVATQQQPTAQQATPTIMVAKGVTSITLDKSANKVYWYEQPACTQEPPKVAAADTVASVDFAAAEPEERISRITATSLDTRQIYSHTVSQTCLERTNDLLSNVAAASDYLYWLSPSGLVRLSTNANPGDVPTIVNFMLDEAGEIAIGGDYLYLAINNNVLRVERQTGTALMISPSPGHSLATDDLYAYWLTDSGDLISYEVATGETRTLSNNVDSFYSQGPVTLCTPICFDHRFVYMGIGNQIYVYNYLSGKSSTPIYTSSEASAVVHQIVSDDANLFFFEQQPVICGALTCVQYLLRRYPKSGGGLPEELYVQPGQISDPSPPAYLSTDGSFLFWRDGKLLPDVRLLRLPNNASKLTIDNLTVEKINVTQGIQDDNHSVILIEGKRTFVRVFAKTEDDFAYDVGARLWGSWDGGSASAPLYPINKSGYNLTVYPFLMENILDGAFLFQLPKEWTMQENLVLKAEINPYRIPLEQNYADNELTIGPLDFKPSPGFAVRFFGLGYSLNGATVYPRDVDFDLTISWLRRAYPLSTSYSEPTSPTAGIQTSVQYINLGSYLTSLVNQSSPDCIFFVLKGKGNECATAFMVSRLKDIRIAYNQPYALFGPLGGPTFYGMISDVGGFVRGKSPIGSRTAAGPAGPPVGSWDTDAAFTDWYSAHEIGHSVGRKHPSEGNRCDHSDDDDDYPYFDSFIGPLGGTMKGFDPGDTEFGVPRKVLPSGIWHDMMGYCPNQWISDYTYEGIYKALTDGFQAHATTAANTATDTVYGVRQGDLLIVTGVVDDDSKTGTFIGVQWVDQVVETPPLVAGPYALRQIGSEGETLANHPFTPQVEDEGALLFFSQVIDVEPGIVALQLVRLSDNAVLATQSVSANAPQVTNVTLPGATSPVSGEVVVQWQATDADAGDTLTYDLLYSFDGGTTFQMLESGLTTSSTSVETANLGGGSNSIFRVVAHDGSRTGYADSPVFEMATKLPQPRILAPADGEHFRYGQLVSFSGSAFDAQVGPIGGTDLRWTNGKGELLGTGALLDLTTLPAGPNEITLTAQRGRLGLISASTKITIYIDDDVSLASLALMVGPDQVGWHVSSDETGEQSTTVQIASQGGPLGWEASTDAKWLTLDTTTGDAPATLKLSAAASAVADGQTLAANVLLTPIGNTSAAPVTIYVTLAKGDVWNPPPAGAAPRFYIPLIVR